MSHVWRLEQEVVDKLNAGTVINSFSAVVIGLLLNSADTGASFISITVSRDEVVVLDDGRGMSMKEASLLGDSSVGDESVLSIFGRNARFLWYLLQVARLEVTSKPGGSQNGFVVGKGFSRPVDNFPFSHGSKIVVRGLFENIPVRLKAMEGSKLLNAREIVDIKSWMMLVHLVGAVSFDLKIEDERSLNIQIPVMKRDDLGQKSRFLSSFPCLFPDASIKSEDVMEVSGKYKDLRIDGIVVVDCKSGLQKIFVDRQSCDSDFVLDSLKLIINKYCNYHHCSFILWVTRDTGEEDNTGESRRPLHLINEEKWIVDLLSASLKALFTLRTTNKRDTGRKSWFPGSKGSKCSKNLSNEGKISKLHSHRALSHERFSYKPVMSTLNDRPGSPSKYYKQSVPNISHYSLSKIDFNTMQIIKQFDSKFILVKCCIAVGKSTRKLLLCFDQHACDERVKMESYYKHYIESCLQEFQQNDKSDDVFSTKLVPCEAKLDFDISEEAVSSLRPLTRYMEQWGIFIEVGDSTMFPSTPFTSVSVLQLPQFIYSKAVRESNFLRDLILKHISDLRSKYKIHMQLKLFENSTELHWVKTMSSCPDGVIDLIASKACHTAVKFGDSIEPEQCKRLLESLSECKFPFQCAHGRPSVVPLAEL